MYRGMHEQTTLPLSRVFWLMIFLYLAGAVVIIRLFFLMILQHDFYVALAAGTQEVYAQLFPERGEVFIQDSRTKEEFPLAINRDYFLVYADTREIEHQETIPDIAKTLTDVLKFDEAKSVTVLAQLQKQNDPYEPIAEKVDEAMVETLRSKELPGIGFIRKSYRYYPENTLAAPVVGFVGKTQDSEGRDVGQYGVEGYWQEQLAGKGGFLEGARSAIGGWIPLAGRSFVPAEEGADIRLTLDRAIQFTACERLRRGMEEYGATSASLVIMQPYTGAILAMCSLPDFDPNNYGDVSDITAYNNTTIFTPYEPGSIVKPLTMAVAVQEGLVSPETTFYDSGAREGLCAKSIRNADLKSYNTQTMNGVLENSINTGMVFVVEKIGKFRFREYLEKFGFGVEEGIELDTEVSGTIDSLSENKGDKLDCYTATASFGQGITATPLQMVTAFSAIANGGTLMKPYIVERIEYTDGRIEETRPTPIRPVLSSRTTALVSGMMVNVIDRGHGKQAKIPGYYIAGKTGTAQIPGPGGYTAETNHSFVGFAPVDDPKFVMIVKFEKPRRKYAESTAVPVFHDIAEFLLQYYQVPPTRK